MTKVSAIIVAALRESNVITTNQTLETAETAEALDRLQSLILSSVGDDLGYIMEDWNVTATGYTKPSGVPVAAAQVAAFTIKPNSRLMCKLTAPLTIKLDPLPQDGQRFSVVDVSNGFAASNLTIDPNGRMIEGSPLAVTESTNGLVKQWLYRSDIGNWVLLSTLATTDDMPFPQDFDDYFIIGLAMRLNPRYGRQLDQQSKDRYAQQQLQFVNRYTQSRLRSVPTPAQSNPARVASGS